MRTVARLSLALLLLLSASVYADRRPHEGKIVRIDPQERVLQIQGEKGDTWNLFLTETTKLKNEVVFEELQVGDEVHFDYVDREGKMFATELRRTHKAKH